LIKQTSGRERCRGDDGNGVAVLGGHGREDRCCAIQYRGYGLVDTFRVLGTGSAMGVFLCTRYGRRNMDRLDVALKYCGRRRVTVES
jgi:hypothetical protein